MSSHVSGKVTIALAVVGIAACNPGTGDAKRADTMTAATTPVTTPATPFFEVLGHHAENAFDYVKTSDWSAARASVDSLTAAMASAGPQDTVGHGVDALASLARLDSAVTQRSRAQGQRVANHLTHIGALLSAAHSPAVPAYVTMLDYYGRELELGAEAKNMAQLSRAALSIRTTWNEVRPQVVERGGTAEAARFDSTVAKINAARTPAEYGRTATPVLDQVDELEAVFMRR